jgi:tetratricopeptide (TPR) repeat protein
MKRKMKRILAILTVAAFTLSSCDKMLDLKPDNVLLPEDLKTSEEYQNMLNGVYDVAANSFNGRAQGMGELAGNTLGRPDQNDDLTEIYIRKSNFFNGTINSWYKDMYRIVERTNFIGSTIDQKGFDETFTTRLKAESQFLRAVAYFDLVNKFALPYGHTADNSHDGIVIRTSSEFTVLPRSPVSTVYAQIISDLQFAESNLPDQNGNYAHKYAAKAMLAKVYFQMNDFTNAAAYADEVINSGLYQLGPVQRFSATPSSEWVFHFVSTGQTDNRGQTLIDWFRSDTKNPTLSASREFYDTYVTKLEDADERKAFFTLQNAGQNDEKVLIGKFNVDFTSVPYLHLTDLKLIRAEAYAELGTNLTVALQDVNDIRARAGASARGGLSATGIRDAARFERSVEMIGEGDLLYQLKRRGVKGETVDIRGASYDCPGMLLQFPVSERAEGFVFNDEGGC